MQNSEQPQSKSQRQQLNPQQLRLGGLIMLIIGVALAIMFVVISAILGNWRILITASGPVILLVVLGTTYLTMGMRARQKSGV